MLLCFLLDMAQLGPQAELQEQHQELPPGFFCNLIYIKQTGQLLTLEGWATGKEGANVQGDWVQASRRQVRICRMSV
jgi:hypothetical protein